MIGPINKRAGSLPWGKVWASGVFAAEVLDIMLDYYAAKPGIFLRTSSQTKAFLFKVVGVPIATPPYV
ncbi:MAG: hypothetical protein PHW87_08675 [Methanothrix sp.]|nr:hypothetical protein [Methanothrix sp.]